MKVFVVLVEPMDTNSYIHDVYGSKEKADTEAAELREYENNAAVSVRPYEVNLPAVEKRVHRQNSDGSVDVTIPHYVTGPNNEDIEPGDMLSFVISNVEKQGGEDD